MTPDEARAAIEAAFITPFSAAHPEADVFIDGLSEPDLQNQVRPFSFLRVGMPKVEQSGLSGVNPPRRYYGEVSVGLFVRQGKGTRPFYLMAATVENLLIIQTISSIVTQGMAVRDRTPAIGWQARELVIQYYFDKLT